MDQQNPTVSEVCIDLWESLNSRADFGNFNEIIALSSFQFSCWGAFFFIVKLP